MVKSTLTTIAFTVFSTSALAQEACNPVETNYYVTDDATDSTVTPIPYQEFVDLTQSAEALSCVREAFREETGVCPEQDVYNKDMTLWQEGVYKSYRLLETTDEKETSPAQWNFIYNYQVEPDDEKGTQQIILIDENQGNGDNSVLLLGKTEDGFTVSFDHSDQYPDSQLPSSVIDCLKLTP